MNISLPNQYGGLALAFTVLYWIVAALVNLSFAFAVWFDAGDLRRTSGRKPSLAGPAVWALATLLGGVFVAGLYWIIHYSSLRGARDGKEPARFGDEEL